MQKKRGSTSFCFSLSHPPHSLLTTLFPASPACAAGVYQLRCWWMKSSRAWSSKSPSDPLTRATPAWPTNIPPQPEEGAEQPPRESTADWMWRNASSCLVYNIIWSLLHLLTQASLSTLCLSRKKKNIHALQKLFSWMTSVRRVRQVNGVNNTRYHKWARGQVQHKCKMSELATARLALSLDSEWYYKFCIAYYIEILYILWVYSSVMLCYEMLPHTTAAWKT